MKAVYLFLAINSIITNAHADSWDRVRERGLEGGKTYNISSGTGFFVYPGYVLTNEHVVQECLTISLRGAVDPSSAELIATDKDMDLALLKTGAIAKKIAYFRRNEGLEPADQVYVIGYPLEHANSGIYVLSQASVTAMDNDVEEAKAIEFTSVIEKGNSGGPLIDGSGNVVGVVQAKKNYYYLSANTLDFKESAQPYQVRGLAIGLLKIKDFLSRNNIQYYINDSSDNNRSPELEAKDYLVNIHCVKE